MARRRHQKNAGLIEVALRSDWKVSAALAVLVLVIGIGLIPMLFDPASLFAPLPTAFAPAVWLVASLFACISVFRLIVGHRPPNRYAREQVAGGLPQTESRERTTGPVPTGPIRRELSEYSAASNASAPSDEPPSRPGSWSLDVLDRTEWKRFEDLCCAFYREKDVRAETTRLGADGGVDIRLFQDDTNPERATAIVQCKALSKQVGVKPVRELRGVMAFRVLRSHEETARGREIGHCRRPGCSPKETPRDDNPA